MANIKANTRTLRYKGEVFLSLGTIEEIIYNMSNDTSENWELELAVLRRLVDNARYADRLMG